MSLPRPPRAPAPVLFIRLAAQRVPDSWHQYLPSLEQFGSRRPEPLSVAQTVRVRDAAFVVGPVGAEDPQLRRLSRISRKVAEISGSSGCPLSTASKR